MIGLIVPNLTINSGSEPQGLPEVLNTNAEAPENYAFVGSLASNAMSTNAIELGSDGNGINLEISEDLDNGQIRLSGEIVKMPESYTSDNPHRLATFAESQQNLDAVIDAAQGISTRSIAFSDGSGVYIESGDFIAPTLELTGFDPSSGSFFIGKDENDQFTANIPLRIDPSYDLTAVPPPNQLITASQLGLFYERPLVNIRNFELTVVGTGQSWNLYPYYFGINNTAHERSFFTNKVYRMQACLQNLVEDPDPFALEFYLHDDRLNVFEQEFAENQFLFVDTYFQILQSSIANEYVVKRYMRSMPADVYDMSESDPAPLSTNFFLRIRKPTTSIGGKIMIHNLKITEL